MDDKKNNVHQGHRKRVRERFYKSGLDGIADHNVLEMLLFFGIPYKDTNEIAHRLIEKFGSFSGVLNADPTDLRAVGGMTDNAVWLINLLLPVFRRYNDDILSMRPQLLSADEIYEYIKPKFMDSQNERVFILCFNADHSLISADMLNEGDISSAAFDIRKMVATVLCKKADSVILVHNHPSAVSIPSNADVNVTKEVFNVLKSLGVKLADHIIISKSGYLSMARTNSFAYIFYDGKTLLEK